MCKATQCNVSRVFLCVREVINDTFTAYGSDRVRLNRINRVMVD